MEITLPDYTRNYYVDGARAPAVLSMRELISSALSLSLSVCLSLSLPHSCVLTWPSRARHQATYQSRTEMALQLVIGTSSRTIFGTAR